MFLFSSSSKFSIFRSLRENNTPADNYVYIQKWQNIKCPFHSKIVFSTTGPILRLFSIKEHTIKDCINCYGTDILKIYFLLQDTGIEILFYKTHTLRLYFVCKTHILRLYFKATGHTFKDSIFLLWNTNLKITFSFIWHTFWYCILCYRTHIQRLYSLL